MKRQISVLSVVVFMALNLVSYSQISGLVTVGPGGQFSVAEVMDTLSKSGINGATTIAFKDAVYSDSIIVQNYAGVSATSELTFTSESQDSSKVIFQRTMKGEGDNFIFKLDSAQYINIKKISFKPLHLDSTISIALARKSNNIEISNCYFESPTSSLGNVYSNSIVNQDQNVDNITIKRNYFMGGKGAVYCSGAAATEPSGWLIQENVCTNQMNGLIVGVGLKSFTIERNHITGFSSAAIQLASTTGVSSIANNHIIGNSGWGINTTAHNFSGTGILRIYNNRVRLNNGQSLLLANAKDCEIVHNTFYVTSSSFTVAYVDNCDNVNIENNIFVHENSAGRIFDYKGSPANMIIDNNAYSPGANFADTASLGQGFSFSEWKSMFPNFDLLSDTASPNFENTFDLLLGCGNVDELTTNKDWTSISQFDFEGNFRDPTKSWRGAHELQENGFQNVDFQGYVLAGSDTVKWGEVIAYANTNASTEIWEKVSAQPIGTSLGDSGSFKFVGLPFNDYRFLIVPDTSVYSNYIPTYSNGSDKNFHWDSVPGFLLDTCDGLTELNLEIIQLTSMNSGSASISGYVYDNSTLKNIDPIPGLDVVLDKIPPSKNVMYTQTDEQGYYEFQGLDTGWYQVNIDLPGLDKDSLILINIADFDSNYVFLNYCVDTMDQIYVCEPAFNTNELDGSSSSQVTVYPNPFEDQLNISSTETVRKIEIFDIRGKLIYFKEMNVNGNITINMNVMNEGVYFLKIRDEHSATTYKVIKTE